MRITAAILAGMLGATAVTAQDVGKFPQQTELASQASISAKMGNCVLKRDRRGAQALVLAGNDRARRDAGQHLRPEMIACLGSAHSATLDGLHVAGAIAEALLDADDGLLLNRLAVLPPVAAQRLSSDEADPGQMLSCAMMAAPTAAADMLRAPAETPVEAAAFRQLVPSLQACAPATGSVTIKPSAVRATLAIQTYRFVARGRS